MSSVVLFTRPPKQVSLAWPSTVTQSYSLRVGEPHAPRRVT